MPRNDPFDFVDHDEYTVDDSASGNNAYYVACSVVGQHAAYAACLSRLTQRKEGRLSVSYAACSSAIGKKDCPAIEMRKQELAAGKAMFFINRIKLTAYSNERDAVATQELANRMQPHVPADYRPKRSLPPVATTQHSPAPIQPAAAPATNDYAAAINVAVQQAAQSQRQDVAPEVAPIQPQPATIIAKSPVTAPKRMTMLEIARRKKQEST